MTETRDVSNTGSYQKPLLAVVLTYVFCPAFAIIAAYALWQMVELVTENPNLAHGPFLSNALLLVVTLVAFVACCAFASWRYAIDLMTQKNEVKTAGMQRRVRYVENMLRLVADNIPNLLFITDKDGCLWFANRDAASMMKCDVSEVVGRSLDKVFPQRSAAILMDRIKRALGVHAPVITVDRHESASGERYMETYHIPLPDTADLKKSILVTQKDITAVIVERERQEQTFKQLVDTLIAVVDRRDPYAAGHSIRVGTVAEALARQMGLDDQDIEACQIAGSLMNLGKILVPRSVLIKTTALNTEELKLVRKAILTSADILSLISFQVPVIPTLRQVLERVDGKGVPEGRRADNICLTARIVAVANAFVALVSPRAHRAGLSVEQAIEILKKDVNSVFDGRVVEALVTYLGNDPEAGSTLIKAPSEIKGVIIDDALMQAD